jgi:hypothetical protein
MKMQKNPVSHFLPPKESSVKLPRANLNRGIYFLRLNAGEQSATAKLIVKQALTGSQSGQVRGMVWHKGMAMAGGAPVG